VFPLAPLRLDPWNHHVERRRQVARIVLWSSDVLCPDVRRWLVGQVRLLGSAGATRNELVPVPLQNST